MSNIINCVISRCHKGTKNHYTITIGENGKTTVEKCRDFIANVNTVEYAVVMVSLRTS